MRSNLTPPSVWRLLPLALCVAALAFALAACQDHPTSAEAPPQAGLPLDEGPAALIDLLNRLSAVMAQGQQDPAATISALQALLASEGERARAASQQIATQQAALTSDTARAHYAERHRVALQQALERFATAQQSFRAHLNEAQKIELSLVLRSLR